MSALVLASALGCSSARPSAERHSSSATPANGASPASGAADGQPAPRFCPVKLPAGWQQAFDQGRLTGRPGEQLQVATGSVDGDVLYAFAVEPKRRRELVELAGPERRRTVIQSFPAGGEAQVGEFAAFDGRYLAYAVTWSFRDFNKWSIYLWDSQTRQAPVKIGQSVTMPDGASAPGPFNYLVAYRGKIAWVQGTGQKDAAVHLYSVAEKRDSVIHRGQSSYPVRFGDWLVWPESPTEGAPTRLRAVSLVTGAPVELPKPLGDISAPDVVYGDDRTFVWSSRDWTRLEVWRRGWAEPIELLTSPVGLALQRVHVSGDVVAWDNSEAQYALDLRTGGYTQITEQFGSNNTFGKVLHVGLAPSERGQGSPQIVVRADKLAPLPGCDQP